MRFMEIFAGRSPRDPREDLAEIFGEPVPDSGDVQPGALRWAVTTLVGAGLQTHDGVQKDQVRAVRALRDAEPRLGLATAVYLAKRAAGRRAP